MASAIDTPLTVDLRFDTFIPPHDCRTQHLPLKLIVFVDQNLTRSTGEKQGPHPPNEQWGRAVRPWILSSPEGVCPKKLGHHHPARVAGRRVRRTRLTTRTHARPTKGEMKRE